VVGFVVSFDDEAVLELRSCAGECDEVGRMTSLGPLKMQQYMYGSSSSRGWRLAGKRSIGVGSAYRPAPPDGTPTEETACPV
jgi:hypothetical protein